MKMGGACGMNGGEEHAGLLWRNLRERHHWEHIGISGRIIQKLILNKSVGRAWNGLIWLGLETGDRVL
jgi:hypothetical protein